ncbi:MAG: hypothetical protein J6S14_23010 [Clostridia bacterium]|nr:hypothetical protein [Clostridia bacterium]
MKPYEQLPEQVEYEGTVYSLNLAYSVFFAVADVLKDDRLLQAQKIETALDMFITEPHPVSVELLTAIYDLLKDDRPKYDGPSYMDIEQDWPYICAGFMQTYGIDLYSDKDIHILRWQALLQGLPKDTKLVDIIGIRSAEMPEPNKHNAKQIAELSRLKTMYALRGTGKDFQNGLASLFEILQAKATQ